MKVQNTKSMTLLTCFKQKRKQFAVEHLSGLFQQFHILRTYLFYFLFYFHE